jgi:hypothetical protein
MLNKHKHLNGHLPNPPHRSLIAPGSILAYTGCSNDPHAHFGSFSQRKTGLKYLPAFARTSRQSPKHGLNGNFTCQDSRAPLPGLSFLKSGVFTAKDTGLCGALVPRLPSPVYTRRSQVLSVTLVPCDLKLHEHLYDLVD